MVKKLECLLYGPSHDRGGIKFNVGGEIHEAQGGEYVIRKDSVNENTKKTLEFINENGKLPNRLELGGLIKNAKKRRR